ncbi:MAG: GNAT family N-acetyltransferase [Cyclobacteriaceae bacterium]
MNSQTVVITPEVSLVTVLKTDHRKLRDLMAIVYPPPYIHLWKDDGSWYLDKFYGSENFEKEMCEPDAVYYFIYYRQKPVGNLRICFNKPLIDKPGTKASKLNRIYLDQSLHGQGIGKVLLKWTEQQCVRNGDDLLWLEAMDSQQQALGFYEKNGFMICGAMTLDFDMMLPAFRGMKRLCKCL